MIPVLLAITVIIFSIMYITPGDVTTTILGADATQADREALREDLGFNRPYVVRLADYVVQVFVHGNFGDSYVTGKAVVTSLAERMPRTIAIGFISLFLQIIIGIPLGIYAATHQGKLGDHLTMLIAMIGVSIPQFWLALMLIILFSVRLHWLPAYGIDSWKSYVLPCVANSFAGLVGMARQTRASILEVIRQDYITTARAKGVSKRAVIFGHALPNGLLPMITMCGGNLGTLFGGSVVIETVFSIPGIGQYMTNGINNRDLPIIMGCVIMLGAIFSVVMLIVDLIYAFVDPRIKAQYSKGGK